MIIESKLKPGDLVEIFKDPQQETELMGTARLREFRNSGLPFILEEQVEIEQETYVLDYWIIEWEFVNYKLMKDTPWLFREDKAHPVRRLSKIGL